MADQETMIESGGDGSAVAAGIVIAIIVAVLLLAGGLLVFSHSATSNSVTLDVPSVTVTTPKS